jgi:hypothetical protein
MRAVYIVGGLVVYVAFILAAARVLSYKWHPDAVGRLTRTESRSVRRWEREARRANRKRLRRWKRYLKLSARPFPQLGNVTDDRDPADIREALHRRRMQ